MIAERLIALEREKRELIERLGGVEVLRQYERTSNMGIIIDRARAEIADLRKLVEARMK